ncbi:MAG: hypothetical protein U5K72_00920 [Balneolaceae bacterium]|nr:hypothetical protein [Balneolaceae bacterium]
MVRSSVILKNSALIFQHNGLDEFSEEDNAIFKRFGVVFEQAYTRFLDLQKAEEQAREAQIEAALERVRSRTMAMQHSEDLSETSAEMFRQIQELGLEQWSCGFNIFDHENNTITQWVSSGDGRMIPPFETPSNEDVFRTITEAFKEDESFISIEMSGEELKAHYDYMSSLPVVGEQIAALKEAGIEVPNHQVLNIAFFKHGYLLFITFEQVPEYHQIYKRFADVFKQTYTRFLDLKKAEKQARGIAD